MSDDAANTKAQTPDSVTMLSVHMRQNSIAKLSLGFWNDRSGQESLVQLTNPIGQHIAFYVHTDEKARVIAELRKLLSVWEAHP